MKSSRMLDLLLLALVVVPIALAAMRPDLIIQLLERSL